MKEERCLRRRVDQYTWTSQEGGPLATRTSIGSVRRLPSVRGGASLPSRRSARVGGGGRLPVRGAVRAVVAATVHFSGDFRPLKYGRAGGSRKQQSYNLRQASLGSPQRTSLAWPECPSSCSWCPMLSAILAHVYVPDLRELSIINLGKHTTKYCHSLSECRSL